MVRGTVFSVGPSASTNPAGWPVTLFEDNFDGTAIDTTKWNVRTDTQNNHMGQNKTATCTVQNGYLSIRSGKNMVNGVQSTTKPWESGYLDTIGKSSFTTGRWAIRCRFPWGLTGAGFWPAFWLRPDDGGLGEIDVMEAWPAAPQIAQTIHYDYLGTYPHKGFADPLTGFDPTQWHVYEVEKEAGSLKFYLDGVMIWDATNAVTWRAAAFDRAVKWNIRLQLQMGAASGTPPAPGYGGWPTAATILSQSYDVDWVRVYGR